MKAKQDELLGSGISSWDESAPDVVVPHKCESFVDKAARKAFAIKLSKGVRRFMNHQFGSPQHFTKALVGLGGGFYADVHGWLECEA